MTYVNGKARTRKLGRYPKMTLKEARAAATAYFGDPHKFTAQAAPDSLQEIAEQWLRRHVKANGLLSEGEITRQLTKYVYPRWKDEKFLDIRRDKVNALLDHIEDNHGTKQADAVLATVRNIMNWYQCRNEYYTSPIVRGMKRDKRKAQDRHRSRILNDNEIRRLWQACTDVNGTYGALVKVLLLTAQRRDKVVTMRWDDVDLSSGEWTIAAQAREKETAGKLKLPAMALEIVAQQPHIVGNPYVFAGRGNGPFNSFSQRKEELDEKLEGMADWVLHDLRRTARSLMSRAGVLPHVSERVVGHAIPGVEGVYDRHSYDTEKAHALTKLATLVETIINPPTGNVVPMQCG
jgi:integrase